MTQNIIALDAVCLVLCYYAGCNFSEWNLARCRSAKCRGAKNCIKGHCNSEIDSFWLDFKQKQTRRDTDNQ